MREALERKKNEKEKIEERREAGEKEKERKKEKINERREKFNKMCTTINVAKNF